MRNLIIYTAALLLAACGDSADTPLHADAGLPKDAPQADAPPDAMPDAKPIVDVDHDGHPAEADCDDHDPNVWQNLAYSFRDADGDGRTVAAAGMVCSGTSLPAGYSLVSSKIDCDDADPTVFTSLTGFVDDDGDGVGDGPAVERCTAGSLPTGFAAVSGDCAPDDPGRWQSLAYHFRDADGDGAAVAESSTVCSGAALPAGYLVSAPVGRPLDCNDGDPAAFVALTVFADTDGDGVGAGPGQPACTNGSPPFGFATTSTDCDDHDRTVSISFAYTAVDMDGDGVTVASLGLRCTAGVLLPPYFAVGTGNDCNDGDRTVSVSLTVFADTDHDGVGAGPGQLACTNGTPSAGFSTTSTDCDDSDAAVWKQLAYQAVDRDRDGATVPERGQVCTNGTLPPPFHASESGLDCDDHDATVTHFAVLYPDQDHDGVGAPPRQIQCIGTTMPEGLSLGGYDEDDGNPSVIETDDDDDLDLLLYGS